ncbi:MAG: CMP-N-acetylneuraminic acid synthetase [[Candidatus Thermochlorobacteriaceae] bacterium GBChlB]|nr:MAG: CMP-N-acetylneuraminic acid synthetase [[Candidatus Thermochlorobacteriaceae] bacterium GBChlB]
MRLCIITARGGSKRIPRKNIKLFLGKPIIAYSISVAIESNIFDEVMVSTDDSEISQIATRYGAVVPFMRSTKTSDDFATTYDVIEEVVLEYHNLGFRVEQACCIYPTAPFVSVKILHDSFTLLQERKFDIVFPVVRFNSPIQRALKIESGKVSMIYDENINKRTQDLIPAYHDAGQFYSFNVPPVIKEKSLMTKNTGAIEISEMEAQDIDNPTDWELAEFKFQWLHKNK